MGEMKTYFFDTYAFFEIIGGNGNYAGYKSGIGIITTKMNLMELHYGLLGSHGKAAAEGYYQRLRRYCVDIDDESIMKANEFRLANKELKMSYVDCLGYTIAKSKNVKFLTGDNAFRDAENAEFVK